MLETLILGPAHGHTIAHAIGGALAVVAATAARSMLFGLAPANPQALVAAAVALGATGSAATIIPAVRAARLPPTAALREN